jgi:hypothetical protein
MTTATGWPWRVTVCGPSVCASSTTGLNVDHAKFHEGPARFKEDALRLRCAVVDVFEVQPGISGHKQIARLMFMLERRDAVIACAMARQHGIINGTIVHYHGFDGAAPGHNVCLVRHVEPNAQIGQRRALITRSRLDVDGLIKFSG